MSSDDLARDYLSDLAHKLRIQDVSTERILCEVENHLRQQIDDLVAVGWTRSEAQQEAIARFGTTERLAKQFLESPPLPCGEKAMIRRSICILVLLSSAYAALHVFFALFDDSLTGFGFVKVALALIVICCGALIFHWQWTAKSLEVVGRWAVLVCGLCMIVVGTANFVWTAHLGLMSGDWEYYGFIGGAMISLIGSLAVARLVFPQLFEPHNRPSPLA